MKYQVKQSLSQAQNVSLAKDIDTGTKFDDDENTHRTFGELQFASYVVSFEFEARKYARFEFRVILVVMIRYVVSVTGVLKGRQQLVNIERYTIPQRDLIVFSKFLHCQKNIRRYSLMKNKKLK